MRRNTSNAKILQQHERRKASQEAKSSALRFSAKQSRFQLRQEELRAQEALQQDPSTITNNNVPNLHQEATFSRFERPNSTKSKEELARRFGTTTTATFGLPETSLKLKSSARTRRTTTTTTTTTVTAAEMHPPRAGMHVADSRSTRRADKFRLSDDNQQTAMSNESQSLGAGLLGTARRPREDENNENNNNEEPRRKKTREERFQEVLANSKGHRAQAHREREERDQQTTALDAEFNDVRHLLERRDKIQEDRNAFARSGTPQVRELLQEFRTNHVAKSVSLRRDGGFTITPLVEVNNNKEKDNNDRSNKKIKEKGIIEGEGKYDEVETIKNKNDGISYLDEADMALLQKIRAGDTDRESIANVVSRSESSTTATKKIIKSTEVEINDDTTDEFDLLMQSMRRETRRAVAGDRTLTEAEEQAKLDQQALLEVDRGAIPSLGPDEAQLTRAEWLSRGGDHAYNMHDDDNDNYDEDSLDISSAYDSDIPHKDQQEEEEDDDMEEIQQKDGGDINVATGGFATRLEEILAAMEKFSREADSSTTGRVTRSRTYHMLLRRLYKYASEHVLHTAQTFRILLVEAQRAFLKRGTLDRATLLLLHATSHIFPMTDYRHEVTTPFLLFLCSTLLQMRLKTINDARDYAVLAGLLCSSVLVGEKFCAEAIIAPLNIIALQVPRAVLEPVRLQGLQVPFPLVERGDTEAVLLRTEETNTNNNNNNNNTDSSNTKNNSSSCKDKTSEGSCNNHNDNNAEMEGTLQGTLALLETHVSATRVVRYAYRLLSLLADSLRGVAAFPSCLAEPFFALHQRFVNNNSSVWHPCDAVRRDHEALLQKLTQLTAEACDRRTPLAMRSFRPRPLRQFEPLLQETTTTALKNEVRELKRDLREDRKRVVRHLQAEANVERRQREQAAEANESQRSRKYHELMGSLQAQQHVMNTVDGLLAKARSKKRKGMTGGTGGENTNEGAEE